MRSNAAPQSAEAEKSDVAIATLRNFYESLMRSQWATPAQLEAYQRNQLKQLVTHAHQNSLFYRPRLDVLFRSDGSIDWERWPEVPFVTRDDVREHGLMMHCLTVPERHGGSLQASTSGTSGRPLKFTMTDLTRSARIASIYRFHDWHGFDWSKRFGLTVTTGDTEANWPDGKLDANWGPPWLELPSPPMELINANTSIPKIAEWVARRKFNYVMSQAITFPALADELGSKTTAPELEALVSFGMQVRDDHRRHVNDVLGIPVIELYGSEESGPMAQQCPDHDVLHAMSELVYIEILDEDNKPCPPGKAGRVVTTVLHNAAQPLIRYEQGDLAEPGPQCPCGRGLRVIRKVQGRVRNLFSVPGGATFSPSLPSSAFIDILHSRWWQVAQVATDAVEVRFHPQQDVTENEYAQFRKLVASTWSPSFKVAFKAQTAPTSLMARKHIDFVNETVPRS
jgi:phenylacetate-CoA ligase